MAIIILLGLFIIVYSFISVQKEGIAYNDSMNVGFGIVSIIGMTNIGALLIGGFVFYLGIVWIPHNIPEAQDDSDYDIKREGEFIHIKFKDKEYMLKKETLDPTDFFFRDMNKKFVSMTTGYQIYNYVKAKKLDIIENEIDDGKSIPLNEIANKFSTTRKASDEEKDEYIKRKKLSKHPNIVAIILFTLSSFLALFILLGAISFQPDEKYDASTGYTLYVFGALFAFGAYKSFKYINKSSNLIKQIKNEDVFVVNGKFFDKKNHITADTNGITTHHFEVKLTDGNWVANKWIEIKEEIYENCNEIDLLVFNNNRKDFYIDFK